MSWLHWERDTREKTDTTEPMHDGITRMHTKIISSGHAKMRIVNRTIYDTSVHEFIQSVTVWRSD